MKRIDLLALALLFTVVGASAAATREIAFARGSEILVAQLDGSHPRQIAKGSFPDISPDGTRIVFNTEGDKRRIALVDVATKKVKIFQAEIPSDNCFGAIWSPDGSQILFNIWADNKWHLASIRADGSGFRYVRKSTGTSDSLWSICWAPDGKSIYGQDLEQIYRFSLEGKEEARWETAKLFPKGGLNSGSSLAVAPDGKRLLVEVDMEEQEAPIPNWEGPPPALWVWEVASGRTTRLTPNGLMAMEACWVDDARILYVSQAAKEKQPGLSEMTLTEKNRQMLLKDARAPSVSRP